MAARRFVICLYTNGAEDLQPRKIYRVLPDKAAARDDYLRVIDDSGLSYLYPQALFADIELPKQLERELFKPSEPIALETIGELRRQLRPLFRKHNVARAFLFGSFARGDETAESDLDVLVEFPKGKSLFDLVALKAAIENQFARKADVVTRAALHPNSQENILREAVLIYESKRNPVPRRHTRKHRAHSRIPARQV